MGPVVRRQQGGTGALALLVETGGGRGSHGRPFGENEPPLDEAKMRGWLVDLVGADVSKRERAIAALSRHGMRSVAALEQYLSDTPQSAKESVRN